MKQTPFAFLALAVLAATSACASGSGGTVHKRAITPPGAVRLAPYSTAVRTGDLIFFSGVVGSVPGGGLVEGGIREETQQALDNLSRAMEAAGVRAEDLVKCTVFLADIRDYAAMNEVYGAFFEGSDPPARSAVGVSGLPIGARVEIECIAAARD